jgi:hypothetical protein
MTATTLFSDGLNTILTVVACVIVLARSIAVLIRHPYRHSLSSRLMIGTAVLAGDAFAGYLLYEGHLLAAIGVGFVAGAVAWPSAAQLEQRLRKEKEMNTEERAAILDKEGPLCGPVLTVVAALLLLLAAIGSLHA